MSDVFLDSAYSVMWTAVGAITQGMASILAIAALILSIRTFRKSVRISHYGELDRMYFDLLSHRLGRRYLLQTELERKPEEETDYDVYAYMVWNFLEAVDDRCDDEDLRKTWYPVINTENALHRKWFDRPENAAKFKKKFREFIQNADFKKYSGVA